MAEVSQEHNAEGQHRKLARTQDADAPHRCARRAHRAVGWGVAVAAVDAFDAMAASATPAVVRLRAVGGLCTQAQAITEVV